MLHKLAEYVMITVHAVCSSINLVVLILNVVALFMKTLICSFLNINVGG